MSSRKNCDSVAWEILDVERFCSCDRGRAMAGHGIGRLAGMGCIGDQTKAGGLARVDLSTSERTAPDLGCDGVRCAGGGDDELQRPDTRAAGAAPVEAA